MLEVIEVSKVYGRFVVLKGVSFVLEEGVLGIFGPNGSGKTTLLKIIAGFEKPTCGRIFFNGKDITAKPPEKIVKMGISIAFQIPRVFWNLSVKENLILASKERKKVEEICGEFNLKDVIDKKAKELSQGKLKLLQIAMAFSLKPKLALLDEPFASLDPLNVELLINLIENLKEKCSIILTAHRAKLLKIVSDKILEIRGGKIVESS